MAAFAPSLRGALAAHPQAEAFGREVARIHRRYAAEVVAKNQLCPFLRDVESGFGDFYVVLDTVLDPAEACAAVVSAASSVVHIVYPCVRSSPGSFESFAGEVRRALKESLPSPPVMAVFHPDLTGDPGGPYSVVGLFRRAPDPFIQLIPEGLHEGGTVFADFSATLALPLQPPKAPRDYARQTYERLKGSGLEQLFARIDEIKADRSASYAPYLEALGIDAARSATSGMT